MLARRCSRKLPLFTRRRGRAKVVHLTAKLADYVRDSGGIWVCLSVAGGTLGGAAPSALPTGDGDASCAGRSCARMHTGC